MKREINIVKAKDYNKTVVKISEEEINVNTNTFLQTFVDCRVEGLVLINHFLFRNWFEQI